jgi:CO/xanthine dehydrogenase FAD-binding subunit
VNNIDFQVLTFPLNPYTNSQSKASEGDNRYHSIFGGSIEQGCYAVHLSDTVPALMALNGMVKKSKRTINAEDFFVVKKQPP